MDVAAVGNESRVRTYPPLEALRVALERHHPQIALACSFQAEDIVVLDMLLSIRRDARIFAIDTGRLNEETYEVADEIYRRYGQVIEWYFPEKASVQQLVAEKGLHSFRRSVANRKECCRKLAERIVHHIRKPKKRVPTKPTRASKKRRLDAKKRVSRIKNLRRKPPED